MKQQGERGRRVVRWQGRIGERVVRWKGGRFLVFFKGGGCRVSPKFHLFCFCKSRERMGGLDSRFSCMAAGMERFSFDLLQVVKIVVGCGNKWDL